MHEPALEVEASRIARLPVEEGRVELSRVLARATNGAGQVDSSALDWNARLVTALRLRGVKVWGVEG
jgi:hypothetical protein